MIKLIECPRDAMQGFGPYIMPNVKADYINTLLKIGFDTIDFGSFVSPKAIPQLRDTSEVVKLLDLSATNTKLLAIIGNERGAKDAMNFEEIKYLGFPYSSSEKFLSLNINTNKKDALLAIENIQNSCSKNNKELIVYLSVAFGNPYNDNSDIEQIFDSINSLYEIGIKTINLADTLGLGKPGEISEVFSKVIPMYPYIDFGFHLHTTSYSWNKKVEAAYQNGCNRFDSVMLGMGGCPMSAKEIIGNLSTENLVSYFKFKNVELDLNEDYLAIAKEKAQKIFSQI
ncbi:MAG: hydroxymethylglutaryl-CoA lyase [Bacteroidetes bacterium]|nr:hydroxymethylglutaryl-CoA lyase [Bacteroidota bacterium]